MIEKNELVKLIEDLKNPRAYIRTKAADKLVSIKDETAIPTLFSAVQKEIDFIKGQYCRFLGKIKSSLGVGPLISFLLGPSENVALEACQALGFIDNDVKTEALIGLLNHPNRFAKLYAIHALGAEKRLKAVPLLVNELVNEDIEIKEAVIDSLRQIGDPGAIGGLLKILHENDDRVIYLAVYALGEIGDKVTAVKIARFLDHKNPLIRMAAVWAVTRLGDLLVLQKLFQMLAKDPSDEVREEVCKRLTSFGGKLVVKPLFFARALDPSHNVRVYADWALKDIPLADKKAVLLGFARENDPMLRGDALLELGKTGDPEFLEVLKHSFKTDENEFVRACAAQGLSFFETTDIVASLAEGLADKESVRKRVAESIFRRAGRSNTALALKMASGSFGKDPYIQIMGIRILDRIYGDYPLPKSVLEELENIQKAALDQNVARELKGLFESLNKKRGQARSS